jgi:hypothetical protein
MPKAPIRTYAHYETAHDRIPNKAPTDLG